jgi:excisionase family DNA binding protein
MKADTTSPLPAEWQNHKVLTADETAKVLRISRGSTYAAIRNGELPVVRVGKLVRITRATLERMLAG